MSALWRQIQLEQRRVARAWREGCRFGFAAGVVVAAFAAAVIALVTA